MSVKKNFLFTPGPTPIPDRILKVLSEPAIHHRGDEFKATLKAVQPGLQKLFGTKQDVMILTASGTGGMEAAVTSLFSPGDSVLVVDAGKFGQRFSKLASAFGLTAESLKIQWGQAISADQVLRSLKPSHKALFIQHSETSTGVLHPLHQILPRVRKDFPECWIVVDGITSIGAMEFRMDEWGVDAAVTASQKALMLPPGLALVSLSARAEKALDSARLPKFYFDLKRELTSLRNQQTGFTPATCLIQALRESLSMLEEEGLSKTYERHQQLAEATRAALKAMGLELAAAKPSVACTSAFFPESVDGKALLKSIKSKTGFHIAGAQDEWEGKVLRISHLGYYSAFDLLSCLAALGRELDRSGFKNPTEKALKVFMDSAPI
jgi:aspartate aminotransferase-like enzyme